MSGAVIDYDERKALFGRLAKTKETEGSGASDENPAAGNAGRQQATAPPTKSATEQTGVDAGSDAEATAEKKRHVAAAAASGAKSVASMFDSFMDEHGSFFINRNGNAIGLDSTQGTDIIRMSAFASSGRGISEDMLKLVRTMLRQAARARDMRPTHVRIGKVVDDDGGTAYLLDLGDADHRCVRVDAQGVQIVTAESLGVTFQRNQGFAELPAPVMPSDAAEAWRAVQPLLQGLAERDHLPLIAAKVEHLRCDSPHHILAFLGPPGSGKTTLARCCVMTIDSFKGEAPSVATEADAITAACQGRHSLLIDNIGRGAVGREIENLLCTSSYGSATTVREYYTNANSLTLKLHAAIHLTGVVPFLRQEDTLDRTLMMRVSKPSAYKAEAAVRAEFAQQHPFVLGGLIWFLQERMRSAAAIEAQQTIKHRMYDFAVTGEAIAQALGVAPGEFIARQAAARADGARDSIEGDGFAAPLVAWLQDTGNAAPVVSALPPKTTWAKALPWAGVLNGRAVVIATSKDICDALRRSPIDGPEPPRTARATTGAIDRVQGLLTKAGWLVEHKHWNGGSNKAWVFGAPR